MNENRKPQNKPVKLALISFCDIEALGVRSLHAFLKGKGADVEIIFFKDSDMNKTQAITAADIDSLIAELKKLEFQLVGLSFFSALFKDAVTVTKRIQAELKLPVIWGGIHATVRPTESIEIADAVCLGEGELSLLEFYERFAANQPYNEVAGFWVRTDERVFRNTPRPLIPDIDSLPFFDYGDESKHFIENDGTVYHGEPFFTPGGRGRYFQTSCVIQTTRGCPFKCSYCSPSILKQINPGETKFVRTHSVKWVIDHLLHVKELFPQLKEVAFRDEIFGLDFEWLKKFCREYKEKIDLPFLFSIHPNLVTYERMKVLVDAGLYSLDIGIQSGSERVRRDVFTRNTPSSRLQEVFQVVRQVGLMPAYDLIVDNPWETEADRDEALEFFLKIPLPFNLRVFSLTFLPGTPITRRALEEKVIDESQVEGKSSKAMSQWRMTLDQPADQEALFWNSIISMFSKSFIPRGLIRFFYHSKFLRDHPKVLAALAKGTNTFKIGLVGIKFLLEGKINWSFIKSQWRNTTSEVR